jgi:hypothetical protein
VSPDDWLLPAPASLYQSPLIMQLARSPVAVPVKILVSAYLFLSLFLFEKRKHWNTGDCEWLSWRVNSRCKSIR